MAGDVCGDPDQAGRSAYRLLQTACIQVMAALDARAGVHRAACGGQPILPAPRTVGVGRCALQGVRQRDRAVALRALCRMELLHPHQVLLSRCHQRLREQSDPIFCALAIPYKEEMLGTIHLFDPHAHTLEPPHATAIKQLGHHVRHAHHGMQHLQGFGCGQDCGEAFGLSRADRILRPNLLAEDYLREKEPRAQGVMLRGRRD